MLFAGCPEKLIKHCTHSIWWANVGFHDRPHSWPPRTWSHYRQVLNAFFKSQMFFASHGTSRHVEKAAPVGPEPILLGPIDTGTIPLCGGPSAKPDCKHKHYELFYVKHYELSIVSQPFLCVFQNQVFIMFSSFFRSNGTVVLQAMSAAWEAQCPGYAINILTIFRPQAFVWSRAEFCDIFIEQ